MIAKNFHDEVLILSRVIKNEIDVEVTRKKLPKK
jgi:hypothetical protein